MKTPLPILSVASLVVLLSTTLTVAAADWPQWRGPNRDDISKETGLLKSWPEGGPKRIWMFENAGLGYSAPSIVGSKMYTMGTRDDEETVLALDPNTGKELWAAKIGAIYKESHGNGPRGTPTVDGDRVYALSGQGVLACLQTADGKLLWKKTMADLGGSRPKWGFTESVLVDGDKVVCTPGGAQGALAALDKKTGNVVWQSKDFKDDADYSSILPVNLNGGRQLIQLTEQSLVGVSAKDGKTLWRSEWQGKTAVIPMPIFKDGYVYISSGYGVGCKLVKVGPGNEASDVYQNKTMVNHHGGVILVGDHVYGFSDGKKSWVCQNFMTGDEVWASKELGKGAIAFADGMFYCVDESTGTVVMIEASPKAWTEHGRFKLDPQSTMRVNAGRVWTHPVIINGKLYLRDQNLIYCYNVKG